MFPAAPHRLAALLAVIVVAPAVVAGTVQAQPSSSSTEKVSLPGYNPGEILRDLANPIVAEVEGHPITLGEVGDAIRLLPANTRELPFEDLYPGVLERLIREQALVLRARRMQLDADPVVRRRMQAAADRVLENELLNRVLGAEISEQALLARYQAIHVGKLGPEEVDVRVILVPTEEQARSIVAATAGGADFAELARQHSTDPSAEQGGGLGFLRQDKLTPEVGAAAFVLEPGQVFANPVRARRGWFVIKVDARRRVPPPGFAEVREQLRRDLLQDGVARVAKEALAETSVRRFNMNGTAIAQPGDKPAERRGIKPQ